MGAYQRSSLKQLARWGRGDRGKMERGIEGRWRDMLEFIFQAVWSTHTTAQFLFWGEWERGERARFHFVSFMECTHTARLNFVSWRGTCLISSFKQPVLHTPQLNFVSGPGGKGKRARQINFVSRPGGRRHVSDFNPQAACASHTTAQL